MHRTVLKYRNYKYLEVNFVRF